MSLKQLRITCWNELILKHLFAGFVNLYKDLLSWLRLFSVTSYTCSVYSLCFIPSLKQMHIKRVHFLYGYSDRFEQDIWSWLLHDKTWIIGTSIIQENMSVIYLHSRLPWNSCLCKSSIARPKSVNVSFSFYCSLRYIPLF